MPSSMRGLCWIDGSRIHAERVLNVAFKARFLVEGHCVGLVRFGHGPSFLFGVTTRAYSGSKATFIGT